MLSFTKMLAEHPLSKYELDELCSIAIGDNSLEITLRNGKFDVPTVERLLNKLYEYTTDKKFLTVIRCEPSARTTFAALRRMGKPAAMDYAVAKAYVINSFHQKLMANVFLIFFRPNKPVKFFSDAQTARKWLRELPMVEQF